MWVNRMKDKHCTGCKWHMQFGGLDCCDRPENNIRVIKPKQLICFHKKKGKWYKPGEEPIEKEEKYGWYD